MTPLLIILGTVLAIGLLLLDGRRSNKRHDEWRRQHCFPPRDTDG